MQSLSSASVCVTELPGAPNPSPRAKKAQDEDADIAGREYLSPSKLREVSGCCDLGQLARLELQVDSSETSLGNFGQYLPRLHELRLVHSVLGCVRDLGTSLHGLRVLWLSHCCLRDLDGLGSLSLLQELYLAFNEVSDISLVTLLSSLQVLDLESNCVREEDQLGYLGLCPSLHTLTLAGNPLATLLKHQHGGVEGYRACVMAALPQLRVLDDVAIAIATVPPPATPPLLAQLNELATPTEYRTFESIPRAKSAHIIRSHTPTSNHSTGAQFVDSCSELTHGVDQVICGNPARALRARRKQSRSPCYHGNPPSPDHMEMLSDELGMDGIVVTTARSQECLEDAPPPPPPLHLPSPPSTAPPPLHLPSPPSTAPPLHSTRSLSATDLRRKRFHRRAHTTPPHTHTHQHSQMHMFK